MPHIINSDDRFEVINTATDESHGTYPTLEQARACCRFDRLRVYQIWQGHIEDGEFYGDHRVEEAHDHDPENIYGEAPYDTPTLDDHPFAIFMAGERV